MIYLENRHPLPGEGFNRGIFMSLGCPTGHDSCVRNVGFFEMRRIPRVQ
jgi:hypothetical protein